MKKFLFLFLSLALLIFANENSLEQKIISKIAHAVVQKSGKLKLFFYGDKIPEGLYSKDIELVGSCDKADLVVADKNGYKEKICTNIPLIVLDYALLSHYKEAVGAYFWQKGRPNIVFIAARLKASHIALSENFDEYIEARVW